MKHSYIWILFYLFICGIHLHGPNNNCVPEGIDDPMQLPEGFCYRYLYKPKLSGLSGIVKSGNGNVYIRHLGENGVRISKLNTNSGELTPVILLEFSLKAQNLIGGPQDTFFITVSGDSEIRQVKGDGNYTIWGKSPLASPWYYTSNGKMLGICWLQGGGTKVVEIYQDGTVKDLVTGLTQAYDVIGDAEGNVFVTDLVGSLIKYTPEGKKTVLSSISPDNTNLGLNEKDELYINNLTGLSKVDKTTGDLTLQWAESAPCTVIQSPADYIFESADRVIFAPWVSPRITWADLNLGTGGLLVYDDWDNTNAVDIDSQGTLYMAVNGCGSQVPSKVVRYTVDGFKDTFLSAGNMKITDIKLTSDPGLYVAVWDEFNPTLHYLSSGSQSLVAVADSQGFILDSIAVNPQNGSLFASVLENVQEKYAIILEFSGQKLINTYPISLPESVFSLGIDVAPDGTIFAVATEKDRFFTGPQVDIWILKLNLEAGTSSIVATKTWTGAGPITDIHVDSQDTIWWTTFNGIYKIDRNFNVTTFASNLPTDIIFTLPNSQGDIFINGPEGMYHIWEQQEGIPTIQINKDQLNFGATTSGIVTPSQTFYIDNDGAGSLNCSVTDDASWLSCTPELNISSGSITASIDLAGLSTGTYNGTITVSDPNASNTPLTITVTLNVYGTGQTLPPFGQFATPIDGSTVSSSIPVTGWVLDDIGIESVKIYRGEINNLVYIGDPVFVAGARPDVEQAYPGYPNNYIAGWGYMLLTNFLPNGGNGVFKIHAIAMDAEGETTSLGIKTITINNANAVKPFGAIDTPTQGGEAFGSDFINWGWVLTPQPNSLPTDGSTINVWVDGVNLGQPNYNHYRSDIARLFPGYVNTDGAVGYFYLDTTVFDNGVHTLQWTATDSGGNTDGIGSRYFTIQNSVNDAYTTGVLKNWQQIINQIKFLPVDETDFCIKQGFNENIRSKIIVKDEQGIIQINSRELEPLKIKLNKGDTIVGCYQQVRNTIRSIPPGIAIKDNTLSWMPGVAYLGNYRFVVVIKDRQGSLSKIFINVMIEPKYGKRNVK